MTRANPLSLGHELCCLLLRGTLDLNRSSNTLGSLLLPGKEGAETHIPQRDGSAERGEGQQEAHIAGPKGLQLRDDPKDCEDPEEDRRRQGDTLALTAAENERAAGFTLVAFLDQGIPKAMRDEPGKENANDEIDDVLPHACARQQRDRKHQDPNGLNDACPETDDRPRRDARVPCVVQRDQLLAAHLGARLDQERSILAGRAAA